MFTASTILGRLAGVVMTSGGQMLLGQPGDVAEAEPPQPDNSIASTPDSTRPPPTAPAQAPSMNPPVLASPQADPPQAILRGAASALQLPLVPNITFAAPSSFPSPPELRPFLAVSARGREPGVLVEMGCRDLNAAGRKEVYGEVISVNINMPCSPGKWRAAEAAGKKLPHLIDTSMPLT